MACNFAPSTGFLNENFYGFPSKYNTLFNKEATFPAVPSTFERPCWPTTSFPSTFERSFGGYYPWANNFGGFPWGYERFGGASFPSTWSFPSTFPSSWNQSTFPSTWNQSTFPSTWNFGGNFNNTWSFNNNTLCASPFRPSSEAEYFTLKNPIRFFEDGTRGLWLCFDLRGYKPEEVCVTVNKAERAIIVEAACDVKEHNISRKFYRKFVLPEYLNKIDITKIEFKSFFGPDNMFYVEGTFPKTVTAEECSSWPAYPYTYTSWSNPAWCWNNNNNNSWNTWNSRPNTWNNWCNTNTNNWAPNNWNAWTGSNTWTKPVACKSI